jgi:hypothetical protein
VELIVDCINFANIFNEDKKAMHIIEELSRNLSYVLHVKRLQIMDNQGDSLLTSTFHNKLLRVMENQKEHLWRRWARLQLAILNYVFNIR